MWGLATQFLCIDMFRWVVLHSYVTIYFQSGKPQWESGSLPYPPLPPEEAHHTHKSVLTSLGVSAPCSYATNCPGANYLTGDSGGVGAHIHTHPTPIPTGS